jgi:hypothetical protein
MNIEKNIFSKLPLNIVYYILLEYDKRFIIRKGIISSFIPKNDTRYIKLRKVVFVKINLFNIKNKIVLEKEIDIQNIQKYYNIKLNIVIIQLKNIFQII